MRRSKAPNANTTQARTVVAIIIARSGCGICCRSGCAVVVAIVATCSGTACSSSGTAAAAIVATTTAAVITTTAGATCAKTYTHGTCKAPTCVSINLG